MSVEVQSMPNGHSLNGAANGDVHMSPGPSTQPRFATSGLILPPPEIKAVIDRTAGFIAKSANANQLEDKIRENQRQDPKFSFLNPADPYHGYYRHKLVRAAQGDVGDDAAADGSAKKEEGTKEEEEEVDITREPPPEPQFILDLPNINGIDLDTMKLTALFTAQRGRGFLASLSAREGRNYQFDFLRPTHSLFGAFNRLVDQYTRVLHPEKAMLGKLRERAMPEDRWRTLELARKHAKWERSKREQDKKREEDAEAERIAFAEIDWHDYAIVQTIEFTAADINSELPPPMSVQEVESMTLAQKRMAAMVMETTADDVEAHRARQAAAEAEVAAATGGVGVTSGGQDVTMGTTDAEEAEAIARRRMEEEERQREIERAQAMQASAAGPMKIRTDYVPKLGAKKNQILTTCSICGQQIPVDELDEHMRIELLDPKWKSQRDVLEARKAQASELQRGANVVSSLKNLASARVDIFGAEADEERRKREEEEARVRRKEREKVVWDGHTASKANTLDKFQTNVNFDEQIAAIHRAHGLGPQEANAIGPGIGPASAPPPALAASSSLPAPVKAANPAYSAATVSSGPQPATAYSATPPVMLPTLHYQGMDAAQPFGYQPPAGGPMGGMHPSRLAQLQGSPPPPTAGAVRSADEMLEGAQDDIPPAKRQRMQRLPGGQMYPEEDWINYHPHPISLKIQLPTESAKPEWKLDGTIVTIPELPLNLLVSTLRDRIVQNTGSTVPLSWMRISHDGRMLANKNSIAVYNLEDEDLVFLTVKDPKKK